MSALGQKQTCAAQKGMSALPPIATAKADSRKMVMSALHPKGDMCGAASDVRYGPKADTECRSPLPPTPEERMRLFRQEEFAAGLSR